MFIVENYREIACLADRNKSTYNKIDLIYLIRKFLRNNDGSVPKNKLLKSMDRRKLYTIWMRFRPLDLYSMLIYGG